MILDFRHAGQSDSQVVLTIHRSRLPNPMHPQRETPVIVVGFHGSIDFENGIANSGGAVAAIGGGEQFGFHDHSHADQFSAPCCLQVLIGC